MRLFIFKYLGYGVLILLSLSFICYLGIYALLGYKVVLKTQGLVVLSPEAAISNIVIGTFMLLYICYVVYTEELK